MKNSITLLIISSMLAGNIGIALGEQGKLYKKFLAVPNLGSADGTETKRFLDSLTLEQLLTLSKEGCDVVIDRDDRDAVVGAGFLVNMCLQMAKKRFPREVLGLCLRDVKSPKENLLWRIKVLGWLKSAYHRPDATGKQVEKVLSVYRELAFSRTEKISLRIRALGSLRGILYLKSNAAYYSNKEFRKAERDSASTRDARAAAVKAGFHNPWEEDLGKACEMFLSAIVDAKENPVFRWAAISELGGLLKFTSSQVIPKTAQGKLRTVAGEKTTPTAVAVIAAGVLIEVFDDLTVADELRERLAQAEQIVIETKKAEIEAQKTKDVDRQAKAKRATALAKKTLAVCKRLISRVEREMEKRSKRRTP